MNTPIAKNTLTRFGAIVAVSLLALTGCASTTTPDAGADAGATTAGETVTITDAWIKATDEDMSAAFGILDNSGAEDATIVSAETDVADMVELHETVENESGEMVMREIEGGFTVPAGGTFTLEPGANHIMLMALTGPLTAGDEVTVTLTFSDGSTSSFVAPVKDYTGAEENYEGGDDMDMDGH